MPSERLGIRFTEAQRNAIAKLIPKLAGRMRLDERKPRTVQLASREISQIRKGLEAAILREDDARERNLLRRAYLAIEKTTGEPSDVGRIPAKERLFQFRITLLGLEPPIWRRIQVRDCSLEALDVQIQAAMGWENAHLHEFRIDGRSYGDPSVLDQGFGEFPCIDSVETRISRIVPESGERYRFEYEYDFGDSWKHEVLFEGNLRAEKGREYPICLEGKQACPPEDVGGIWGYLDYLDALEDPAHERHDEFIEWGETFDPERFDAKAATAAMCLAIPDSRERVWRRVFS